MYYPCAAMKKKLDEPFSRARAAVLQGRSTDCFEVLADLLAERGDPRGEFARVQLELERGEKPALREREKSLLEAHGDAWLGDLTDCFNRYSWRGGFWRHVDLRDVDDAILADTLRHPSAAVLEMLRVSHPTDADLAAEFARHEDIPLRVLGLGALDEGQNMFSYVEEGVGELNGLEDALPHLEELHVIGASFTPRSMKRLRVLDVRTGVTPPTVEALSACRFPALKRLVLGFELHVEPEPSEELDPLVYLANQLLPLMQGDATPALEHLVLATFFDEGGGEQKREALRQLRGTPLGARLTRLEFTTPKDEWEMLAP